MYMLPKNADAMLKTLHYAVILHLYHANAMLIPRICFSVPMLCMLCLPQIHYLPMIYPMILRRRPLSTLTVLSGPMEMLRFELASSLPPRLLCPPPLVLLLRSGWITNQVAPPPSSSCCISCSCGPLRPLGFGDLGDGGGGKRVAYLVILSGRVVNTVGSGIDSMSVTFSNGMEERSDAGRSAGEQPTIMCRRWEFVV